MCRLPASSLSSVEVTSGTATQVVVASGFSPALFTASNPGVASLVIKGMKTPKATIQNTGHVPAHAWHALQAPYKLQLAAQLA